MSFAVGAMALAATLTPAGAARAEDVAADTVITELSSEAVPVTRLRTALDQSVALRATPDVGKVVVSQPELIQVRSAGPDALYVIGKNPGAANLLVYDKAGQLTQTVDVEVGYDAQGLRDTLADALPEETITVTALSSGLVLDGEVSSPEAAAIAEGLAQRVAPDAVFSRLVARGGQVRLRVRIVEVNQRGLVDLGAQVSAINAGNLSLTLGGGLIGAEAPEAVANLRLTPGDYTLNATLRALETRGRLDLVAEPTLLARSGEKAQFHAGGELPYPVPSGVGEIALEFRRYGTAVAMTPTVQSNGMIRLQLEAELSSIDDAISVQIDGFAIPALLTRKATTAVEVRDGQTLLIAGLFEDSSRRVSRAPPWLDKLPLIGPLTRSVQAADQRRELAILVTPEIVRPQTDAPAPQAAAPEPPPVEAASRPTARDLIRRVVRFVRPPLAYAQRMAAKLIAGATRRA
ncbi:MAG: pilus assembly protein N-terminal domain-containing protein [Pseudomonadota bacterium]